MKEYVEIRDGAYYVVGTRIGLDVVVDEFHNGRSAEGIFEAYPAIGSLARVYGAIAFILDHPQEIESYLKDQDRRWEEFRAAHPIPSELMDRLRRAQRELSVRHS